MSHLKTLVYSSSSKSKRQMMVWSSFANSTDVTWQISGRNSAGGDVQALITTTGESAVAVAVDILKNLAPELLAPKPELKFSELPVGTFLRNKKTKKVVRVVEKDERFEGYALDDEMATAEDENGDIVVPVQEPFEKDYGWDIVEAKPVTRFEVVE